MATHSRVLAMDRRAWQVQSVGSQRVGHDGAHTHRASSFSLLIPYPAFFPQLREST